MFTQLIQDMSKGFIQPSTFYYASHVFIVKRKVRNLRFCVEYLALKKYHHLELLPHASY